MTMIRNAIIAGLAAVTLLALVVGCEPEKGESGFDQSCKTRGGTPVTVKRDGSKVRICQPPPAPVHQWLRVVH